MDPFEEKVQLLLEQKRKDAMLIKMIVNPTTELEVDTEDNIRLPFSIAKTVQYLNQDAYLQKRKALKKQKDNI